MNEKSIYIADSDLSSLRNVLGSRGALEGADKKHLRDLREELDRATIVPDTEIPGYVVTMRSKFLLKNLESGEVGEYQLVFPGEADIGKGKISVLAPIGTALLGYREQDVIEWTVPAGVKRFRVEQILYQPQAARNTAHV